MRKISIAASGMLLLSVLGCAHNPTPAEVHQKQEVAASRGREQFSEELAQKNVAWYVYGSEPFTGFNRQAGLPEQKIGMDDAMDMSGYVRGHNESILQYMSGNGPVPGSFKAWEPQLYNQAIYFAMHQSEAQPLRIGGARLTSPGGQYTVLIKSSGANAFALMIFTPTGQKDLSAPAGAQVASGELIFGPSGSDLAFTRWPATPQPIYAAVD